MKLAWSRLRLWLVHQVMRVMVRISHVVQLGHPYGRAPDLRPTPAADETLGSFEGGKVYAFERAIVVGELGGVAISGKNEYFANLTQYFRGPALHPAVVRLRIPRAKKLAGAGGYLCTYHHRGNYYHWMIDLVPRLWLLEQAGFGPKTLDHVFVNGDNRAWEREPFLAHGFRQEQICWCSEQDRFQVDRLFVPDRVANERVFAPWKAKFLRRLFPPSPEPPTRLLFCGRKDASWRRLLQEADLFARLQPLGFEPVYTSGKTIAEQARLFSTARIVVGVHGATMTNLVFSPPGTLLIDIQCREAPYTFYTSMCATIGASCTVIPATPTRRSTDPVDANRADLILTAGEIDAIVAQVEKTLAP